MLTIGLNFLQRKKFGRYYVLITQLTHNTHNRTLQHKRDAEIDKQRSQNDNFVLETNNNGIQNNNYGI